MPEQYKAMIFSKWLRSLRYGNEYFKLIDQASYFLTYHKYIESILARPYVEVDIAALTDDHDVVLGFSVTENNVLHYVHVQKDHRRQGIAKELCKGAVFTTHMTNDGLKAWASHPEIVFNPFIG